MPHQVHGVDVRRVLKIHREEADVLAIRTRLSLITARHDVHHTRKVRWGRRGLHPRHPGGRSLRRDTCWVNRYSRRRMKKASGTELSGGLFHNNITTSELRTWHSYICTCMLHDTLAPSSWRDGYRGRSEEYINLRSVNCATQAGSSTQPRTSGQSCSAHWFVSCVQMGRKRRRVSVRSSCLATEPKKGEQHAPRRARTSQAREATGVLQTLWPGASQRARAAVSRLEAVDPVPELRDFFHNLSERARG